MENEWIQCSPRKNSISGKKKEVLHPLLFPWEDRTARPNGPTGTGSNNISFDVVDGHHRRWTRTQFFPRHAQKCTVRTDSAGRAQDFRMDPNKQVSCAWEQNKRPRAQASSRFRSFPSSFGEDGLTLSELQSRFWGQTTRIPCNLSPQVSVKRDCSAERVKTRSEDQR